MFKFLLTPAWPNEKYPNFNNIVIKIKTRLKIDALFLQIKKIEKRLGRIKNIKNSPRTCDIDIIDFNGKNMNFVLGSHRLIVPIQEWKTVILCCFHCMR